MLRELLSCHMNGATHVFCERGRFPCEIPLRWSLFDMSLSPRRSAGGGKIHPGNDKDKSKKLPDAVISTRRPSDEIEQRKIALVLAIGMAARQTASGEITDHEFHALLRHAVETRILTIDRLAEIARVDRTTASRWVNMHNTPAPLIQELVLLKIDDEASKVAREMETPEGR